VAENAVSCADCVEAAVPAFVPVTIAEPPLVNCTVFATDPLIVAVPLVCANPTADRTKRAVVEIAIRIKNRPRLFMVFLLELLSGQYYFCLKLGLFRLY